MLDQVWFKEKYPGDETLGGILQSLNWQEICKIVYRLLTPEARAEFPATVAKDLDENGEPTEMKLTGPEHLLVSLGDLNECLGMLTALTRAIMLSNPLAAEMVESEVKKSLAAIKTQAVKRPGKPTGHKSFSTSTTRSAGRKNTSRR